MKRLIDPLVLIPAGFLVYVWFAVGLGDGSPTSIAIMTAMTCFLGGFALSSWLASDENEATKKTSDWLSGVIFKGGLGVFFVGIFGVLIYAAFFLLPNDTSVPFAFRLFFQGLILTIAILPTVFMSIDFARKRKGSILIQMQEDEVLLGDTILGAAQLKLKKQVNIQRVTAKLVGCTKIRRRTGNGGSYTEELVHYEDEVELPIRSGSYSGDQHYAEFQFETSPAAIRKLVESDRDLHWYVWIQLACTGLDLESKFELEILSEDEWDDELE